MIDRLRELLSEHGGISGDASKIDIDADLYKLGMSSFASVQLMLALEETFDIEFPESMLTPKTFGSLGAISSAVQKLAAA